MKKRQPLDSRTLASVYLQLSQLDRAGIAPLQALPKVQNEEAREPIRNTLRYLNNGEPLSKAGKRAGLFSGFDTALMEAAEQSGNYPFAQLATLHEARDRRRRAVISRLWLPGGVLALALLVRPLPKLIGGKIDFVQYLMGSVGLFLLLLAVGILLWKIPALMHKFGLGQLWGVIALKLPVVGKLVRRRNMLEFTRALGLLAQAGVPMFQAMPKAINVVENPLLRQRLQPVEDSLRDGSTVTDALAQSPDLDGTLLALVNSGEVAGSMDGMLLHYAALEEQQVNDGEDSIARWIPRLIYILVAGWMIWSLIASVSTTGSMEAIDKMERNF